jgi:hypothetical protein
MAEAVLVCQTLSALTGLVSGLLLLGFLARLGAALRASDVASRARHLIVWVVGTCAVVGAFLLYFALSQTAREPAGGGATWHPAAPEPAAYPPTAREPAGGADGLNLALAALAAGVVLLGVGVALFIESLRLLSAARRALARRR